jgi:hypothetical protein
MRRGILLAAGLLALAPPLHPGLEAQLPGSVDARFAGLEWRFVRIKYHYVTGGAADQALEYYGEPWAIDAPAAEQN